MIIEAPFWPHVVEPAVGLDRLVLAFLSDAYHEEMVGKEMRTVLKLHPAIAPYKYAVLPLMRNRPVDSIPSNDVGISCSYIYIVDVNNNRNKWRSRPNYLIV
jgi:glycyl-tRNA synthetase (class II)